jgi:putative proteasome-type protease
MTYCIAMKVEEGIVGLADTLITSGREMTTLRKVVAYSPPGGTMFVMTSGLRSLRDKTLTYFENALVEREAPFDRLFEAVNLLATQVRQVAAEDKAAIVEGGLSFNIHALVGGQMAKDGGTKLYLLYPEGNWVDTGRLKFEDSMRHAFKVGCLSFDSTRISAADVGFPMDAVLCRNDSFEIVERRFHKEDLEPLSNWWQERMRRAINEIPTKLIDQSFDDLKSGYVVQPSDHLGQT